MTTPLRACLVLGALIASAAQARAQEAFQVGYRVMDIPCPADGHDQPLTLAVWYPTAARPAPHTYAGPIRGNVAPDAEPLEKGGPWPLLVFSHGFGGGGISAVFLTEALAARGWVVAAPDHHDPESAVRIRAGAVENFDRRSLLAHARDIGQSTPADRDRYRYRIDEMKGVVDHLLSSPPFHDVVDAGRVAVGGHSFGGFTALGLSGTMERYHDPRIGAVLLFSTGAGSYLYGPQELASVRIPFMLFMGERERGQLRGTRTMAELSAALYASVAAPKYFLEVRDAHHFSFSQSAANTRRGRLLSGTDEQFELIRRYSIAFLESHVAGKPGADPVLDHGNALLTRYQREPPAGDKPPREGEVRVHGALRAMMHEGRTSAVVSLDDLLPDAQLYAVGALADLAGEITVIAGRAYLAHPVGPQEARTQEVARSTAAAALLVSADVPRWRDVTIQSTVPFQDLDREIARLAEAADLKLDRRFPFLLQGTFEDLHWHVIDGRRLAAGGTTHADHQAAAVQTSAAQASATLVGFFSQTDAGVFTHKGSWTHVHCVLDDASASGHVDHVVVPAGTVLKLPFGADAPSDEGERLPR